MPASIRKGIYFVLGRYTTVARAHYDEQPSPTTVFSDSSLPRQQRRRAFFWPLPQMATSPDEYVLNCSDSELAALISASPNLVPQYSRIALLSPRCIAKAYRPDLAKDALEAAEVAYRLGVRVPRFVRSVQCEHRTFIIMERIEGNTLHNAWPSLG